VDAGQLTWRSCSTSSAVHRELGASEAASSAFNWTVSGFTISRVRSSPDPGEPTRQGAAHFLKHFVDPRQICHGLHQPSSLFHGLGSFQKMR
jgi:hypothetical protein